MDDLRRELCALHAELPRNDLVAWTSGNISTRADDLMLIKPSGVSYAELTPESMVLCDLYGAVVEGDLAASSDAATHGYIYRNSDAGGIVHTHSAYATAWAIRGEPIPCVMTAMADEFGGEIPVGPFALIGDEEIGRGVVDTLAAHRSRAVLMRSHGVFALGDSPRDALKSAVMCEDVARTAHLARALGPIEPLDPDSIDALYDRYQSVYGQH
jgi:L-ribulose-5-phosphate 4-epimerase